MPKRWEEAEDRRIARQLKKGVAIGNVTVADRKPGDIRKRAVKLGLFVPFQGHIKRRVEVWAIIEEHLRAGNKSIPEISAASGLGRCLVTNSIKLNRARVHIADYGPELPGGRVGARIFALGEGEDATVPVTGSGRRALKAPEEDPETAMIREATGRLRRAEARGELIRRDPYVEALFGRYRPSRQRGSPATSTRCA